MGRGDRKHRKSVFKRYSRRSSEELHKNNTPKNWLPSFFRNYAVGGMPVLLEDALRTSFVVHKLNLFSSTRNTSQRCCTVVPMFGGVGYINSPYSLCFPFKKSWQWHFAWAGTMQKQRKLVSANAPLKWDKWCQAVCTVYLVLGFSSPKMPKDIQMISCICAQTSSKHGNIEQWWTCHCYTKGQLKNSPIAVAYNHTYTVPLRSRIKPLKIGGKANKLALKLETMK